MSSSYTDVEGRVKINIVSGAKARVYLRIQTDDLSDYYMIEINTADTIKIFDVVNGAETERASNAQTVDNSTDYFLRFYISGYLIKGKVWAVGTTEPDWQVNWTDGATLYASGYVGIGSNDSFVDFDDFQLWETVKKTIAQDDTLDALVSYSRKFIVGSVTIIGSTVQWIDNFTTTNIRGEWDTSGINSAVQSNSALVIQGNQADYSNILIWNKYDDNAKFEITCTPDASLDYFKIAMRYDNTANSYYALECRIGDATPSWVLSKTVAGVSTLASRITTPVPTASTEYVIAIQCSGDTITGYINEGVAFQIIDDSVSARGRFAVMLYGSSGSLSLQKMKLDSERVAIGTASDASYSYFGTKELVKKVDSIRTAEAAEERASLELTLAQIEQTTSKMPIFGDQTLKVTDMITLDLTDQGVSGDFVIYSLEHIFENGEFTTNISISEKRDDYNDAILYLLRQRLKDAVSQLDVIDLIELFTDTVTVTDVDPFTEYTLKDMTGGGYAYGAADAICGLCEWD